MFRNRKSSRRGFLCILSTFASVTASGCISGGGKSETPTETVRSYLKALDKGDNRTVNQLTHTERPDPISRKDRRKLENWSVMIDRTDLINKTGGKATVRTLITINTSERRHFQRDDIKLRKENGGWRIYGTEKPERPNRPPINRSNTSTDTRNESGSTEPTNDTLTEPQNSSNTSTNSKNGSTSSSNMSSQDS